MSNMTVNQLPNYDTVLFNQVWDSAQDFYEEYNDCGLKGAITEANCKTLYYLLFANYGNSPIAFFDKNLFKMNVWSTIWKCGPTWQKRLDIQNTLRSLTDEQIMSGSFQVMNHAYNPSNTPSSEVLEYINDQNTVKGKKGKLDAYMQLYTLLDTDVTSGFIERFRVLFKAFVSDQYPTLYVTEEEEDEDDSL